MQSGGLRVHQQIKKGSFLKIFYNKIIGGKTDKQIKNLINMQGNMQ